MSSTTAFGFIITSLGIMSIAWREGIKLHANMLATLPFIVPFCLMIGTILLVQKIGEQESLNNYSTNIPVITFIIGAIFSVLIGVLLRSTQIALQSSKSMRNSLSLIRATFEATADGILVVNMNGEIVDYNQKFLQMWDIQTHIMPIMDRKLLNNEISSRLNNKEDWFLKLRRLAQFDDELNKQELKLKNGNVYEVCAHQQVLDGEAVGRVWSYRDVTMQKKLELELLHQTTYDGLTGLPNRALLLDLINRAMDTAKMNNGTVAIILIDLDKFSQINNIFGRSKGDMLLKQIAECLKRCIEPDSVLGRIGGDEFLIILNNANRTEKVMSVINRLLRVLANPFDVYGHEIKITTCIGVAYYPKDGRDTDSLLDNADVAMLRAKKDGRNEFQFYTQDLNKSVIKHIELESQLYKAIDEDQFVVHYQPIFDLTTNKIIGVEALVRWLHPEEGLIPPGEFIPMAEEMGLIQQIGEMVLRKSCTEVGKWFNQGITDIKLSLSINVSANQFKNQQLEKMIKKVLTDTSFPYANLDLELTESILIAGSEEIISTLHAISNVGISISIDDFGTGYCNLSYLQRFPINKLKIDRSFIEQSSSTEEGRAIVKAITVMGKSLNLIVLAEGVETKEQLEFVKAIGCDQAQGFYFSKPLDSVQCVEFIKKNSRA